MSVSLSGVIEMGSELTLYCSSEANPTAVNYTWWYHKDKATVHVQSVQNYTISNIQPHQSGNYSCFARNTIDGKRSALRSVVVEGKKHLFIHLPTLGYLDLLKLDFNQQQLNG